MSQKKHIIFGTDGWRGVLGDEMNEKSVSLVAQAFADYISSSSGNARPVVIGYDSRRNSPSFAKLFAEILSGNKIKVFLSTIVIPTPVLSYAVRHFKASSGVMITASHNPSHYNGVKFKGAYGGPFATEETHKIEKMIGKSVSPNNKSHVQHVEFLPPYIEHLKKQIDVAAIGKSGLELAVDSMGGAGGVLIGSILQEYGVKTTTMFGEPTQDFSGRLPEPIAKNLDPLQAFLSGHQAVAFGVATDGDADRLGVLLDGGTWLSAQETILLLAEYIVESKKLSGDIVKTASVTEKVRTYFQNGSRRVIDVQVGFKYICETMLTRKVAAGFEESGGYGFGNHLPERDGIFSALLMMEMIAHSGYKSLSSYVKEKRQRFGAIHYDRIDIEYPGERGTDLLAKLNAEPPGSLKNFQVKEIAPYYSSRGSVNGLKFFLSGENRWLLLRTSETEPLARIYAEGESDDEVKTLLKVGKKYFDQ
jgi:phosphomannomutase